MEDAGDAGFAPEQSLRRLRRFVPKRLQPLLRGLRKRYQRMFLKLDEPYKSVFPYTQVHEIRQHNLVRLAQLVVEDKVPGAIVECGVLDGGTAALMAWGSRNARPPREVHLFDAWEGLPETTAEDGAASAKWAGEVVGSPNRVKAIMVKLGIAMDRVRFHRGWFDQTFPSADLKPVALVHVDCDFYEPTKLCLEKWYPGLSPGGYMAFDDYSAFSGCQKAVDEFLRIHSELKLERMGEREGVVAFFVRKPQSGLEASC